MRDDAPPFLPLSRLTKPKQQISYLQPSTPVCVISVTLNNWWSWTNKNKRHHNCQRSTFEKGIKRRLPVIVLSHVLYELIRLGPRSF
uniref:Uncharacterized protein n=1 Tax=Knipowitschia caucasica TaxID=637954 RepID=A0AAV2LUS9_KNICA